MVERYGCSREGPVLIKEPSDDGLIELERIALLSHRSGKTRYECGDCGKEKLDAEGWQRVEDYYPAASFRSLKQAGRGKSEVVEGVTPSQPRDRCPRCLRDQGRLHKPMRTS